MQTEIAEIRLGASAVYIANDYWEDSLVLGLVNVLNAFIPLVLWS